MNEYGFIDYSFCTKEVREKLRNFIYGLKNIGFTNDDIGNLILESISTNSTAFLDYSDSEKIKALGNPTEAALLLWLHKNGINYLDIRNNAPIIDQLTFSTERKFMATLVDSPLLKKKILYVKGAPEIIFSKCKNVLVEQFVDILEYKNIVESELVKYQKQAMRTLGFAYKIIDENDVHLSINELVKAELTFLGIVSISDPIRPDVPHAVTTCLDAGINIKIITGDIAGTTKEIAQQIGIWNETDRENTILTGTEFEALSDEEILHRLPSLKILCRARPTDKQRLVKLLQQSHEIVAVTGDGTNDAPALNYAHVGLSMGSGTAVAKEASDITLLDDSFNSISTAVMWGRSLYQNIQRFLLFQLTVNLTAVVIVFLGSIFDFELPLTITQMLWVNLIMDTFAAGALASLPPNHFVMQDMPLKTLFAN